MARTSLQAATRTLPLDPRPRLLGGHPPLRPGSSEPQSADLAANSHQARRTHAHETPRRDFAHFERDTERDIDSIVNLFADDATIIDEGEERHGTAAIRAWQTGAASKYTYTTEITTSKALGPDRYLVTGRLTGNFPGGTADLNWDFTIAGQYITRLVIAP